MAGLDDPTKLAVKNVLERRLPALRLRISELPDISRRYRYSDLHGKLIWLEIEVKSLREELAGLQLQEELEVDTSTKKPGGM